MPRYDPAFPTGSRVRIGSRSELERFQAEWLFHDPLQDEQLDFAGAVASVTEVGFYHGGAPLYRLDGIPGVWHEQCLGLP